MAHYKASIASTWTPQEVFDYMSDFSTSAEWDPGVLEAERLEHGEIGLGSEFRIIAEFLGRSNTLIYRIVELDAPRTVTFRGESATVVSLDRLTCEDFGGGTRLTYDAELTLRGPLRVADPLLALAFNRVGDRAVASLREVLSTRRAPALR